MSFTKEHILEEIKRTTRENSGKSLGQGAFKNETGIGPYEWGRYWPRFGDALQEAGFEQNKAWTRLPDELLIEKMILKIREFGRYPVLNELRIEADKDHDFPYHIIKKRGQDFIVKKIVEYCSGKSDYNDILIACKPIIEKLSKKGGIDDLMTTGKVGEVYLLKSGLHYKIGKSSDPTRRVGEIGTQLAEKPVQIHSIKTDDQDGVESYWHKRFESKHIRGEWFKLNSQDVSAFKRWRRIF